MKVSQVQASHAS